MQKILFDLSCLEKLKSVIPVPHSGPSPFPQATPTTLDPLPGTPNQLLPLPDNRHHAYRVADASACLPAVGIGQHSSALQHNSASQAGPSDAQQSNFHTPPLHGGDPSNHEEPNLPDGGSDGGGSGDGGIPKDLAEPPEDPVLALTRAIHALARSSQHSRDSAPKTKVREPDTFDGSDPKKLREFLVTFAQSYLKGMALAWFEPDLLNPDDYFNRPLWMDDYQEFLHELTTNFSPHDAVADAVQNLENLSMKDSSCIPKYVIKFNRLPDRIKDKISRIGKPATLVRLRELAQTIDAWYWERKAEISRTAKPSANKSLSAKPSDDKKSSSISPSAPRSDAKGKSKSKDNQKPDAVKSDITHLLSKDGKLNAAECQRHLTNNLCLFCGEGSHSTKDCLKSTSHAAKAHAAVAEAPPAPPAEKAEAKN
ncbi:hypothetical protein PISMIDRAFT_14589 [Pisolithus microcarpus 441]|uniref:Retrotransposon gag domain-containing protein n=1 Tax=Pisolithus microcarpus 441 TaxID=765257 RepID=A0A0C9YN25_9AGAM|nr:hypothetical protein PISMIDRAFT_14589 [Pisolithus microcarpus 441]